MAITVIGLGAGDLDQLQLGVYKKIKSLKEIYVRTFDHPVLDSLKEEGVQMKSFDDVYEKHDTFAPVYREISDTLIHLSKNKDIVYAVPGHPLVAE